MFRIPRIFKILLLFGFSLSFIYSTQLTAEETSPAHNSGVHAAESTQVEAGHSEAGHGGPILPVLLSLVVILLAAKIGGDLAVRLGQPEVLGELVFGVLLGNLTLLGITGFEYLEHDSAIAILSELGVILLLFEVGLETNLSEMTAVGASSFLVALLGVIAPFFLGWGVAAYFVPEAEMLVHIFVGATLTATSVGITARVLKDIDKIRTTEARIILGAAVIDDILGLLTLAVVSAVIAASETGQSMDAAAVLKIFGLSTGFLVGAVMIGRYVSPFLFKVATYLKSHGLLLGTSLVICFGLSYIAGIVGLAPIVGAFTAGLILDPVHYKNLAAREESQKIEHIMAPITSLLVPIFFVIMGARVDLSVFGDPGLLGFAAVLTLVAIIGKQVCALGVLDKGVDRFVVGLGMIPRGEVGLIFVGIGASMTLHGKPVVDAATFGAVVIMVIVTTMVTPPLIKWRFSSHNAQVAGKPQNKAAVKHAA